MKQRTVYADNKITSNGLFVEWCSETKLTLFSKFRQKTQKLCQRRAFCYDSWQNKCWLVSTGKLVLGECCVLPVTHRGATVTMATIVIETISVVVVINVMNQQPSVVGRPTRQQQAGTTNSNDTQAIQMSLNIASIQSKYAQICISFGCFE